MPGMRVAQIRILRKTSSSQSSSVTLEEGQPFIDMTQTPARLYVGQGSGSLADDQISVSYADSSYAAAQADKLATTRKFVTDLHTYGATEFEDTANGTTTVGIQGILPTLYGGTGNATGRATSAATADEATKAMYTETPESSADGTRIASKEYVDSTVSSSSSGNLSEMQTALDDFASNINDTILNFDETTFTAAGVANAGSVKRLAGVVVLEISAGGLSTGSSQSWCQIGKELGTIPSGYRPMEELQMVPLICGETLENSYNRHYVVGYCTIGTNGVITVTEYDVENSSYGTSDNHTLRIRCGYSCSNKPSVTAPVIG